MTVVILGAGIGGLAVAHYLTKSAKFNVRIIEATSRVGGWIKSSHPADYLIFEHGARTLRPAGASGRNALQLVYDLGLNYEINPITTRNPASYNRFIYRDGNLLSISKNKFSIFAVHPITKTTIFSSILRDMTATPLICEDDSIYNFVERRFGTGVADYIISPLVCGVCAGNAKELSVNMLLRSWFEKEQQYGGVVKGYIRGLMNSVEQIDLEEKALDNMISKNGWVLYSIKNGMESIPSALYKNILRMGGEIEFNTSCEKINLSEKFIETSDGKKFYFEHLVSALPAFKLAPLLAKEHPFLTKELQSIPYVTVGVVNIAFSDIILKSKLDGFGFLVPPIENLPILGVIYDSCLTNSKLWTNLTIMIGGYSYYKHFNSNTTKDDLYDIAVNFVRKVLQIDKPPNICYVSILENCIPQYLVGHDAKVKRMETYIRDSKLPLFLTGSAYHGFGVNDVVLSAKKTASDVLQKKFSLRTEPNPVKIGIRSSLV